MDALLKTVQKEKVEYTLIGLILLFVSLDISVNKSLAEFVDSMTGRVIVYGLAAYLVTVHPILGAVALYGAYELIRRSEQSTGSQIIRKFVPTQAKKDAHFNAFNQFPLTLEEEMVAKMVPLVSEEVAVAAEYKPVMSNINNATML